MTSPNSSAQEYRLPRSVAPLRYDLHLVPDLEAALFTGSVRIHLDVRESVDTIVCNAAELEIRSASLAALDTDGAAPVPATVALDEEEQRATFGVPAEIPPGHYALDLSFSGVLNDQLRGFYRSTYTDPDGTERVIATTQFEAADARRAFPCWDEPDRKAVFSVTLDVPAGMAAISNWPEAESEDLGEGRRRVRFGDTIPMSTYLVAFIVGPLEATPPVDVDGTEVRVHYRPGKEHLAPFALEAAAHALRFFVDWFALPYPCPKLDLIAIPDFASGAMENLGAVTFREIQLLVDADSAAQRDLELVAVAVDHELAHMWFGDLVTMRWWNGIWLNEAFATFMSLLCLDDFRPEWRVWDSFGRMRTLAMEVDALHSTRAIEHPVHRPEEAEGMFDVLTYEKGAAVLRMLERFVGTQRFRDGVRSYLAAHVYGNTETTDLWDAIEEAAESEPVRSLMDTWIFQGGFPLVDVTAVAGGVRLEAEPFARLREGDHAMAPGSPPSGIGRDWLVPVIVAPRGTPGVPAGEAALEEGAARVVLGASASTVELESGVPVVANVGGYGFYRARYDEELFHRLVGALDRLAPLERYCLVSDTWTCAHSGIVPLEHFLSLVRHLGDETDPSVWSVVGAALDTLNRVAADEDRPAVQEVARAVLGPQLARVGWDAVPGEDAVTDTLRAALVRRLGLLAGDDDVHRECAARLAADRDGTAPLPVAIAGAVMSVVVRRGGEAELDAVVEGLRKAEDPQREQRHLEALAEVRDPVLAERVHQLCLGEIRSQDAPYVLEDMLLNRHVQTGTWHFVADNWDEMNERFPRPAVVAMLRGIVAFDQVEAGGKAPLAEAVRAYLTAHPLEGREQLVDQHLEVLEVNLAFARRERARLGELLRDA